MKPVFALLLNIVSMVSFKESVAFYSGSSQSTGIEDKALVRIKRRAQYLYPTQTAYIGQPHYTGGGTFSYQKKGPSLEANILGIPFGVKLEISKSRNHTYETYDSNAPVQIPVQPFYRYYPSSPPQMRYLRSIEDFPEESKNNFSQLRSTTNLTQLQNTNVNRVPTKNIMAEFWSNLDHRNSRMKSDSEGTEKNEEDYNRHCSGTMCNTVISRLLQRLTEGGRYKNPELTAHSMTWSNHPDVVRNVI